MAHRINFDKAPWNFCQKLIPAILTQKRFRVGDTRIVSSTAFRFTCHVFTPL